MAITPDDFARFDIKKVVHWSDSGRDGAPLLTMPNIPHPLHGMAPRTILGNTTWTHMRKRCYFQADYKCQACGADLGTGKCHAHEVYDINYPAGESKFKRTVCLCPRCHVRGIHSGRMLTMFKKGDPLMSKEKLLDGVENLFRIIYEWNQAHPKEEPLRAYGTFIDYIKWPPISKEMLALVKKYDMKFYIEDYDLSARWDKWHLIIGDKSYHTKYKDADDWAKQMDEQNAKIIKERPQIFTGGIFDEIDKIIAESKQNNN